MTPAQVSLTLIAGLALGCAKPTAPGPVEPVSNSESLSQFPAATPEPPPAPEPPATPDPPGAWEPPPGAIALPLSEVMTLAVYTPSPDAKALQQTKAARFDKLSGQGTVTFCVETNGQTSDIHTIQKFPGDPLVDKIFRDTIERWRFKPMMADGKPVKVCTEKRFKVTFV